MQLVDEDVPAVLLALKKETSLQASGNAPSMLWFDFNLSLFKVYLLLFWGLVMYEI